MVVIGGTVTFGAVGGGEEDAVDEGVDVVDQELLFEDYNVVHSKSGVLALQKTAYLHFRFDPAR